MPSKMRFFTNAVQLCFVSCFLADSLCGLLVAEEKALKLLEYMEKLNDSQRAKIYENMVNQIDRDGNSGSVHPICRF